MGVAVHGPWCGSRTIPIKCRYCGDAIFYFTCNCDSKVFFDQLGDPWPIHHCANRPGSLDTAIAQYGEAWVEKAMATRMMQAGWRTNNRLEDKYAGQIQARQHEKQDRYEIFKKVPTRQQNVSDIGTLREIIRSPNLLKSLHLDPNSVGAHHVLKHFPKGELCQITIHVGDIAEDDVSSFTAIAAHDQIVKAFFQIGHLVSFVLKGIPVPGRDGVWMLTKIHHLD